MVDLKKNHRQGGAVVSENKLAIRHMRTARKIHVQWLRWAKLHSNDRRKLFVGGVRWHATWIRRYDRVIRLLEREK